MDCRECHERFRADKIIEDYMNEKGIVPEKGLDGWTAEEMSAYIEEQNIGETLESLEISGAPDGNVALDYTLRPQEFERIRRITGYLVGTIDRWNNAKRAEEHDRVKHSLMH
jgi:hypothetical protein